MVVCYICIHGVCFTYQIIIRWEEVVKNPKQIGQDHDQRLLAQLDARQNGSPSTVPVHPLPISFDFDSFGKEFLSHYFTRGFGYLSKKEIELQIFTQLCEAGVFMGGGSNKLQQASVLLRIPIARVRTLTYEMQLRSGIVDDAWFRVKLLNAIATTRYKQSEEKIEFGVEDPMLRAEIEGRLKSEGRFPDYGMSREILHIGIDDFAYLLGQVLTNEERQEFLNSVPKRAISANASNMFNHAVRLFINAAATGAGDEIGRKGVRILFGFLTGGIETIATAITVAFNK